MSEATILETPFFQKVNGQTRKVYVETSGKQVVLEPSGDITGNNVVDELLAIHAKIGSLLKNADAMQYKGVVNADGDLPTTYETGWTWKVGTKGVYKGQTCEVGDMIIAGVSREGTGNEDGDFSVIQANIDGAVTGPESAVDGNIVAFDGISGKVVKSSDVPMADVSDAIAKRHEHTNKTNVLDKLGNDGDKLTFDGKTVGNGAYVSVGEDDPGFEDAVTALNLPDGAFFTVVQGE